MTTNLSKEIGGYFGLEIEQKFDNVKNQIALNSARNCLRYVIRAFNIKEIYIPYYTCPVVWQAIQKEHCKIKFYHIDKTFMPDIDLPSEAYIVYTNYFGICSKNVKDLTKKYKNIIVDNSQAFYMPKYGIASFNSIRKFFGVPDGALLYIDKRLNEDFEQDVSFNRCSHLLKRLDIDAQFGYKDFCKDDDSLIDEPIKFLSNLTKTIFNSINIEKAKIKRLENFDTLSKVLSATNELKLIPDKDNVPMVYPYLIKDETLRQKLIQNKIYVAKYWSKSPDKYYENYLYEYLLPLPIDQRYDLDDMTKIIEVINEQN